MKLCIAEKPSVATEIAKIVQAKSRKNGYYEGNGYYVSWTFGHLCTLKEPDDYTQNWRWWKIETLPMIPARFGIKLIQDKGIEKQFTVIKSLVEKSSEVINCGDAGIEGELIQRWVLLKANCKLPLKRLWISSLTEEALVEGFNNLKDGNNYNNLFAAGNARAIGDWLLGMNATRLYTLKFAQGKKAVLSIGRVQTPTLALIVDRYKEIQNFVPEPFWEIKTKYRDTTFNSTKGRYVKKEEAEKVLNDIKGLEFTIDSQTRKKGIEQPPPLFDLTSLQVECNKKYSLTADETLKHIQVLYEKKLVTYPRVDTTFLPTDMYPKIENILKGIKPYEKYTSKLIGEKIKKSKKVFDDSKITDHHAIVPTGIVPGNLTLEQKRVYDVIARRFISVFYPDCIVSNTTVLGETGGYQFKATGKVIVEPGWRELYPKKQDEKDDVSSDQIMPEFVKGEKGPHSPDLLEKETSPPKLYTEATLLRAMETAGKIVKDDELRDVMKENGIGRPSTRANIIETLFRRKYIVRQRKNLVPTNTGIELIGTIQNDLLKSVELTGLWEKKLRQIEKGLYDPAVFMDEMKKMVTDIVIDVKRQNTKTIAIEDVANKVKTKKGSASQRSELLCPKCKKGIMLKGNNAFGCSEYKNGCSFIISFIQYGKKLTDKQIEALISKNKTGSIKDFVSNGKKVTGYLFFDASLKICLNEARTIQEKGTKSLLCPECKKGTMLKGKEAYGCSEYKNGCSFIIPFSVLRTKYNMSELTQEIVDGVFNDMQV